MMTMTRPRSMSTASSRSGLAGASSIATLLRAGRSRRRPRVGVGDALGGLLVAELADRGPDFRVFRPEDRRRQQGRVGRAGLADRQRADRDSGGHLNDRQQ